MKSQALKRIEEDENIVAIDDAIYRIKSCCNEVEVANLLRPLVQELGADSYVFIHLNRDRQNRENYRYLIGCSPKWCQMYNANKWFAIDPFIQYALNNSGPILGSGIRAESVGQQELMSSAAENGFRSGMVIPAHAGNQHRLGVLYVGSSKPAIQVEVGFLRNRNYLRAISLELFEWMEAKLHTEIVARLQLDNLDLELLRLELQGFTAEDSANMLGCTTAIVNHRFLRINDKLEVHHKKDATKKAIELGILRGVA